MIRVIRNTKSNKVVALQVNGKKYSVSRELGYALSQEENANLEESKKLVEKAKATANDFMNKGKPFEKQKSLAPGALKALKEYSWPGNVRELQNVIERAYILSDGVIVESSHLAENVFNNELKNKEEEVSIESFEELTLDELERRHICRTLDHLGGNKTKTAKTLGITVKTLYNKLHSYGMIQVKEA